MIIYNSTSAITLSKNPYFVWKQKQNSFKRPKYSKYYRNGLSFPYKSNGYLGTIRTVLALSIPFALLFGGWLYLFANTLSLDYHIQNLNQKISVLEEKKLDLQEQLSSFYSLEKIEKWAQENGFIEINKIGYLDLSNINIARAPSNF